MKPQFDLSQAEGMPHFTIEGTMPSLNEYLAETGRRPQIGNKLKREYKQLAEQYMRLSEFRYWEASGPIIIHYVFYEYSMKRDHDNVFCFASKCIQDALQECGHIKNDGWKDILNFTHDFYLDKNYPRIEVYIEEIDDANDN